MNIKKLLCYISTGLIFIIAGLGSIMDLIGHPMVIESANHLQLAHYWIPFLGTMKILGTLGVIQRKSLIIQEASYAGLVFYFIGATYSHFMVGDGAQYYLTTLFIIIVVICSYYLNKKIM
jgi:hypothetical protein